MHNKVECVTITCDNCKETFVDNYSDFSIFPDEGNADMDAENNEWYVNDGVHYCPGCWDFDENDNLLIKKL